MYSGSKKCVAWLLHSDQRKNVNFDTEEDMEAAMELKKANGTTSSTQRKYDQEYEESDDEGYESFMYTTVSGSELKSQYYFTY